jgi:predicted ArsR family transcriptional regulator
MDPSREAQLTAVAALQEPTRRRLYEYVVRQARPVTRDEAADALDLARATAAFHLDKLADEGLLEFDFERRTGRSGPGAGRPAKLYRRSGRHIGVSIPELRYEFVGHLLAAALEDADSTGDSPRAALDRHAVQAGRDLAGHADQTRDLADVLRILERQGFEPRVEDGAVVLGNCPFHALAKQHTDLVCTTNLRLLEGLLTGLGLPHLRAQLHPTPDHCCVRLEPA